MAPKRKIESQPKLKLHYFNLKARGEPIRLLCAYAGLELEDHRFADYEEFVALRDAGKFTFGQAPMLEVDDGKHLLVQTSSILRYLARLAGLYPSDDLLLAAKVDAALEQENDAFVGMNVASYPDRHGVAMDEAAKLEAYKTISNVVLPRHFSHLEKLLKASSTGWIANTAEPSPADFAWFVRFQSVQESKKLSGPITSLQDFPAFKAFVEKFKALEAIKEYHAKQEENEKK